MLNRTKKTPTVHQRRKTIKLILVKWRDATHQEDDDSPPGTLLAWTIGFEVQRNDEEVALCMEVFEDGSKRNITTIPLGMVQGPIRTLAQIPIDYSQD